MTIPTLISKYHKGVTESRLKKFYSTMNQAIRMSTIENGETSTWPTFGHSGAPTATYDNLVDWYNQYLAKYLKATKLEKNEENDGLLVYLPDGSVLNIPTYIYDMDYIINSNCLKDNSCEAGVDSFRFRFSPSASVMTSETGKKTVLPYFETYSYRWDGTLEGAKHASGNYGCYDGKRALCAKLIQVNGWKIPDDYPYKF